MSSVTVSVKDDCDISIAGAGGASYSSCISAKSDNSGEETSSVFWLCHWLMHYAHQVAVYLLEKEECLLIFLYWNELQEKIGHGLYKFISLLWQELSNFRYFFQKPDSWIETQIHIYEDRCNSLDVRSWFPHWLNYVLICGINYFLRIWIIGYMTSALTFTSSRVELREKAIFGSEYFCK